MTRESGDLPLLQGFGAGASIGWRRGQPVSIERFLGIVAALRERLPQGGFCINACEDRLNFLAGFAAAMTAGSVTLLPQSRAPKVLRELAHSHRGAYRLVDLIADNTRNDEEERASPVFEIGDWGAVRESMPPPSFPPSQVAVILFTSGTTGTPRPHAKSWGALVGGARALLARVPQMRGCSIAGAVPPQHMWGLETTVMLPLQGGCMVNASCPLLPAEIAAALESLPGSKWLVATPAHLRACALSDQPLPQLSGVLCSTAPLASQTAQRMEALAAAPVIEIYGSTETGAIATRRTALTQVFEAVEGIEFSIAEGPASASGGHLDAPVELNDVLLAKGDSKFEVQGRASDLVKIGGKRSSLGALTAELNTIPGVTDGVFWLPDAVAEGRAEPRLSAFAVAPGIDKATLLAHLRDRLDPVFLPRPLVLVRSLPRNAAGKLSREDLKALAASSQVLDTALRTTGAASEWHVVPASHSSLQGHFPGNPVVPGVWLLALVERALRQQFGATLVIRGVPEASFRAVLRPEERFRIGLDRVAHDRVDFRIEGETAVIADGTFQIGESP